MKTGKIMFIAGFAVGALVGLFLYKGFLFDALKGFVCSI